MTKKARRKNSQTLGATKGSATPRTPPGSQATSRDVIPSEEVTEAPEIPFHSGDTPLAVVGIGASAGGLETLKQFFSAMPPDSGMAFVVIQHLDPTHESHIAELLAPHTSMPVMQLKDEMRVEANHVYIIPPNKYVSISGKTICLTEPEERRGLRVPIDYFLRSLAYDQHERAIGIIMSGAGTDGTLGVREIKAAGGIVIVQDPETAIHDSMPRSAIATGIVDCILPVAKMPEMLVRYIRHWYFNGDAPAPPPIAEKAPDQLNSVVSLLRAQIKYDFSCYKKGTLTRRIQRRMGLHQFENMDQYVELLREDKKEASALYKDLLIGVTNFFREPDSWVALEKHVVVPLIQRQPNDSPIRVWVPGCATGEEAYSIAMLLTQQRQIQDKSCPIQIFASDIDQDALALARAGVYPENIAADVPPDRLKQFFIKGEHTYRIDKEIRDTVVFAEQNLISDPPFSKLDLISCRNLMIYLEAEVQKKILTLFHFAIREGGFLFLGASETISQNLDQFEAISRKHRLFRRLGSTRLEKIDFPIHRTELPEPHRKRLFPMEVPKIRRMTALAHQLVLQRFAPACAVINRKGEVLYLHGPVDDFLQLPPGELGTDLLAMAREGLRTKLRSAVHQAIRDDERVRVSGVRVKRGRKYVGIQITAEPIRQPKEAEGLLLVSFEDRDANGQGADSQDERNRKFPSENPTSHEMEGNYESIVRQLEEELHTTREDLQSAIEELETSNEEFRAANEEVTSINEELQSTNEELETSKEELQSLNEELLTVNSQLEQKLHELESTNNDLKNLLASTDIATLFLDRQFKLKRFTPAADRIFRVIDSDIGRPIGDLTCVVDDEAIFSDAEKVLERLTAIEFEVRDSQGHTYLRRISPYRTEDNRIDGVVITFTDISARKRHEEAQLRLTAELEKRVAERTAQLDSLVEEAPDAILVVNRNAQIVRVNRGAEAMFGLHRNEMIGKPVEHLIPATRTAVPGQRWTNYVADLEPPSMGVDSELFGRRANGELFPVEIQLSRLVFKDELVAVAAVRDVTERKRTEASRAELASIFNNSPASIMVLSEDGTIENWNRGAERLFGYSAREVIGQHVRHLFAPGSEGDFAHISNTIRRSGMVQDFEKVGLHKNGTRIELSLTSSPVDDSGRAKRFCYVAYDISERKRLEHQLASALDLERQRLGRELHDSLGQQMTGISMLVAVLKGQRSTSPSTDVVSKLESSLEQAKIQLRSLAKGLFPVDVDARGLKVALGEMATELSDLYQVPCRFECLQDVLLESNFTATQLYLFAREAVHNAAKHAQAREIVVRLETDGGIRVAIRDDGNGLPADADKKSTFGMQIMRYRCSLIGGTMQAVSTTGNGTVIACSLQHD